ncbi:hypothetical protein [Entomomonas asaccharolytica]|uniref:Uncharacterized protein n=1 Tax=Entomomonas asaccharolytica TaxID=2785331 RepID=A0A974NDF8_9GAMM|nr:hypothetical protein [Entomomonas asaccharolytica]QQP84646.1 hypothetical protein JHT90_09515 [Entomomonas asaccharolytica]
MTIYTISAHIKTNTAGENLYYDMELYKTDWSGKETYALKPTGKHPLQADYKTQLHPSQDISDPAETCYILSIILYRKIGVEYIQINQDPMTAIMPLKGFQTTDKEWGASREFEYFETAQDTQKAEQGQVNIYKLNISSKPRIFEAKEHGIGDPLDPFTKEKVEEELKIRMTRPAISYNQMLNLPLLDAQRRVLSYPFQDRSSLCGPASFFYCLLEDRPDIYQQVIKELWETGKTKIGTLKIEPGTDCKNPTSFFRTFNAKSGQVIITKLPAIDWMTLASLRDGENSIFDYQSPDNEFSGITMDGAIKKWFQKIGVQCIYSTRFNLVLDYLFGSNLSLREVCLLNSYINSSNHIITLIGDGLIQSEGVKRKVHWIVWQDKLRLKKDNTEVTTSTPLTEIVTLKLFSWGVSMGLVKDFTLKEVLEYLYGGLVFSKIP